PFVRLVSDDLCLAILAASVPFAVHGVFDLLVFDPKVALAWFVLLGIASVQAGRAAET
ncbi:MAG: hypothetical protein JO359_06650, partial [Candidatus Eremiobacteraeota bacterium]|nr:hypothetical protein [Candidatus Eremiobacteraeota bacterium]